jgi:aminoglycoside phosphotransferase (APT) family kinase protein
MSSSKMHPDELEIDEDLVRRLLKAQAPQWAGLPIEPVPSAGTDNALYRLGSDMVIRLPRVGWAAGLVEKEQTWLPRLAPHLPLAIPRPLAVGQPGEAYPWQWSVYGWLEGDEAGPDNLSSMEEAAAALARFILSLESLDTAGGPRAGSGNFYRGVPLMERDAPTRAAISSLKDLPDTAPLDTAALDTAALVEAWERALAAPRYTGPPTWVHGDLRPGNLLANHGRLSAVIDFGCLGVGDPACDLQVAWSFLPSGSRAGFRRLLGVHEAAWERGKGWALSVSIIALPYYWGTNRILADIARRTIGEVLETEG